MSPKPDRLKDYLRHIVQAIDRATLHVADIASQNDFENDLKASDAVVRCIEIVGEGQPRSPKWRRLLWRAARTCHGRR